MKDYHDEIRKDPHVCPNCGSHFVLWSSESDETHEVMSCDNCGQEWHNFYEINYLSTMWETEREEDDDADDSTD